MYYTRLRDALEFRDMTSMYGGATQLEALQLGRPKLRRSFPHLHLAFSVLELCLRIQCSKHVEFQSFTNSWKIPVPKIELPVSPSDV